MYRRLRRTLFGRVPLNYRVIESANTWAIKISAAQLIDKVDVRLWGGTAAADSVLGYGGFSMVVAVSRGAGGDVVVAARFLSFLDCGGFFCKTEEVPQVQVIVVVERLCDHAPVSSLTGSIHLGG